MLKISDYIFALLMLIPTAATASNIAPAAVNDTVPQKDGFVGVQYQKVTISKKTIPLFSGYGIYTDLAGLAMAQVGKWGQYEVGAHFGLKRKFYPAVELGIGQSNYTNDRTSIHFNTHSPYFRVGMDYNLNKDRTSRNRYFLGVRYGFSTFSYDLNGPSITDDYWNQTIPFEINGAKGTAHWGELLFGIQSQIWKFIHLGWTIRYKARLYESVAESGHAFYIPGYGKNGSSSSCFGGSFNVIFEL